MSELATIAGTVAVVQILFKALGEWSAARRIVAVGGLDAQMYARYRCVPLQFAGSRFAFVRRLVAVTGFFSVRPKSRKQVFAACDVFAVRDGREMDYRGIRPRDTVRILLDAGEHPEVFDRSMRRGVASYYRTVAIRDLDDPESSRSAHCVTVRTRGMLRRDHDEDGLRILEFAATGASPRSDHRSGPTALNDVPDDAIELVIIPPDTYRSIRDAIAAQPGDALYRWFTRRNPNPVVAAMHWVGKYFVPLAALQVVTLLAAGSVNVSAVLFTLAVPPFLMALLVARFVLLDRLRRHVQQTVRKRRKQHATASQRTPTARQAPMPLQHSNPPPPMYWTGSTALGMSMGRQVNGTDMRSAAHHAWKQFASGILPPRAERLPS